MTELREGDVLDGRYRIGPRIARGGMSVVHRAVDMRLGRLVAAKVMDPRFQDDEAFRIRFKREARSVAGMTDPCLVNVFDQGVDPAGHVFLIMELVDGGTLRELLRERGPMPPHAAAAVMRPVLRALALAHGRGLVHRDLKPENVLISDAGQVKLADFGLVRAAAGASVTSDSVMVGTAAYLSPEQVRGLEAGPASDVYSAGVLLHELLTGRTPFAGDTAMAVALARLESDVPDPSESIGGVPPEFDALVARACAHGPGDRFADAGEFLAALDGASDALGLPAFTVPAPADSAAHRAAARAAQAAREAEDAAGAGAAGAVADVGGLFGAGGSRGGSAGDDHDTLSDRAWSNVPGDGDDEGTAVIGRVPEPGTFGPHAGPAGGSETRFDAPVPAPVDDGYDDLLGPGGGYAPGGPGGAPADGPGGNDSHGRRDAARPVKAGGRERTRTGCAIWLIVALVAALGIGLGAWWLGSGRYGEVPKLTGMSVPQAEATVRDAGFTTATDEVYHDDVPEDRVAGSEPGAGSKVVRGDVVTLLVSLGKPTVPGIPGNHDPGDYRRLLEERTLTARDGDAVYSSDVAEGGIASVDPAPGTAVATGSPVTVHLSKGPAPVTIPDVVGLKREDAEKVLENAGLKVGNVRESFDGSRDADEVIAIEPGSGTEVDTGSSVTLEVNNGIEVPDVSGMTQDEAEKALRDAGLAVRSVETAGDSSRPAGQVERTNPRAGDVANPDSPGVVLYVSRTVEVPLLIGRTVGEARSQAEAAGMSLRTRPGANDGDRVITQSPRPGATAKKGDKVTVSAI